MVAVACGPAAGTDAVAAGQTSSGSRGEDDESGTVATSAAADTVSADSTAAAQTTDTESSTGDVQGPPVCINHWSFPLAVEDAHHADVDGDGTPELWLIRRGSGVPSFTIRGYAFGSGDAELRFETTRDESQHGFADIDGDGRDDLVASDGLAVRWYPGNEDASLAAASLDIDVDGPWAWTFADADDDGDDDVFRLRSGPDRLELLTGDNGSFATTTVADLTGVVPPGAVLRSVVSLGPDDMVAILSSPEDATRRFDVLLRISGPPGGATVLSSLDVDAKDFVGAADIDSDGDLELVAQIYDAEQPEVAAYHVEADGLVRDTWVPGSRLATWGDFEGTGTPQLMYLRQIVEGDPWQPRLHRLDGSDVQILLDNDFNVPVARGAFDYDTDGVDELYVVSCDLGCYAGYAELTEC